MSGAGFMRLVKNVGDSISKIAGKKTETDSVSGNDLKLQGGILYSILLIPSLPPSGLKSNSKITSSWTCI